MKLRRTNRPRAWPLFFDGVDDLILCSLQGSIPYSFSRCLWRSGTTPIPSRTRLWNAAVAKIFGGSLPEKIARCLGFYLKSTAPFCNSDRGFVCLDRSHLLLEFRLNSYSTALVTALKNVNGRWRQVMRLNHKIEVSATFDVLFNSGKSPETNTRLAP
jgi:hypothetical protein